MDATENAAKPFIPAITFLTSDLHDKWVPLLHAFRLIWRSGPFVLGAYLVLSALLDAGSWAFNAILWRLFASDSTDQVLRAFNSVELIHHVLITSVSLCLYAAVFDRGLATTAGFIDDTPLATARRAQGVKVQ